MKITTLGFAIALLLIGCQKTLTEKQADFGEGQFTPAYVQEWFNNNFVHSTEYTAYDSTKYGAKRVDWKKGLYRRSGNAELVSFPLIKGRRQTISSAIDTTISKAQFQKTLEASFTRVLFSKNSKNEISVRVLDYVPEYSYLQSKNFSRALVEADVNSNSGKFSGSVSAKKWSGQPLSVAKFKNGKIIKAPYTSYR
ncbi:MAG: hypothetical protein EOO03_04090 [Chitinophagaceae bacterium]|nr:MAG: hypothetical protein EOO03_04090 [Chitinophagaceae bacterium]